jgi:hypothetical protein
MKQNQSETGRVSKISNLAYRDRHLIFFVTPDQLVIIEDGRWKTADYSRNN